MGHYLKQEASEVPLHRWTFGLRNSIVCLFTRMSLKVGVEDRYKVLWWFLSVCARTHAEALSLLAPAASSEASRTDWLAVPAVGRVGRPRSRSGQSRFQTSYGFLFEFSSMRIVFLCAAEGSTSRVEKALPSSLSARSRASLTGARRVQCPTCPKSFLNKKRLAVHKKSTRDCFFEGDTNKAADYPEKRFGCSVCRHEHTRRDIFTRHLVNGDGKCKETDIEDRWDPTSQLRDCENIL